MLASKNQEKWSICEIIGENASFRTFDSDEVGYISSQPRYDHFDISPYEIVWNFVRKALDALTNRCERNSQKTQDLRDTR